MITVGMHFMDGSPGKRFDNSQVIVIDFHEGTVKIDGMVIARDNGWLPGFNADGEDIHQLVIHI